MATRARILFLDDMEWRHKEFELRVDRSQNDLYRVYTAEKAIEYLNDHGPWTNVLLDHDLSHEDIMIAPGEKGTVPTGMAVVDHIMTMDDPPRDVYVHSCNGPAAEAMEARLLEHSAGIKVTRIPFPELLRAIDRRRNR